MLPVIVLGAGPVGLGAALELARCKVPSILIERNATTSWHPKSRHFNTRTMEIARGWGRDFYQELCALDVPPEWKPLLQIKSCAPEVKVGSMDSRVLMEAEVAISPVNSMMSSQDQIEPVMLRQVRRSNQVDVRFNHEMIEFVRGDAPDDEGVAIRVRNQITGEINTVHGSALVAADGACSAVRSVLQMPMHGTARLAHYIHCCFLADLEQHVCQPSGVPLTIDSEHNPGLLQPLDDQGRWSCQISVPEHEWSTSIFTPDRCVQWVRDAAGLPDLEIQVLSIGTWQVNALVAEQFVVENVVLMGDAAHMSAQGVNVGLQGMHNVIWKMALWLRGKAGRRLLETYTTERRPHAKWAADRCLHTKLDCDDQHGLELGNLYESRAVCPDWSAPPAVLNPCTDYVPTGRPGHRAPHVWLRHGQDQLSTLDLWGPEFTVLAGPQGNDWASTVKVLAEQMQLEMGFHLIGGLGWVDEDNTFLQRYGLQVDGAVLIRPDGYVAWRSPQWSEEATYQLMAALQRILF